MRTAFVFNECAEALKTQVRTYWATKQRQIEKLLPSEIPAEAPMDLVVYHDPQASLHDVRAVLPLPSATLTAEAVDADVQLALDRVAELLVRVARQEERIEQETAGAESEPVDATSADSFPASDAPSWTALTASGPPPSDRS